MRAALFEKPGSIVVREGEDPRCGPDGMVVRVLACGICGSDVRNFRAGLRGGMLPQIMGHEIAGTVEEVGSGSRRFRPGDLVAVAPDVSCGDCHYCRLGLVNLCTSHRMIGTHWPGGFAQFRAIPAEAMARGIIHPIPSGVPRAHAALAEPLASVVACQEAVGIGPGMAVAVFGDGPAGCLHLQWARSRGASSVLLAGRRRLGLAATLGPDRLIDLRVEDPVAAIRDATDGLGADVAIVATPAAETQQSGVACVRRRGTVVLFGGLPRNDPFTRLDANAIHYGELRIVGSFSYPSAAHAEALRAIAERRITPEAYLSRTVGLEGSVEASGASERGEVLKVVVDPWRAP